MSAITYTEKGRMRVEPIVLRKGSLYRPEALAEAHRTLDAIPADRDAMIKITEGIEGRREIQNRLYGRICGQVSAHTGKTIEYVMGWSKYQLLLSYKAADAYDFTVEEGAFERDLCDLLIPKYQGETLHRAFDRAIRSKTLRVGSFAAYVDRFLRHWSEQGVGFVLSKAEDEAVRKREQETP